MPSSEADTASLDHPVATSRGGERSFSRGAATLVRTGSSLAESVARSRPPGDGLTLSPQASREAPQARRAVFQRDVLATRRASPSISRLRS